MNSPKVLVVDDSAAQAEALVRVMSAVYTVVKRADEAVYQAKEQGRNTIRLLK